MISRLRAYSRRGESLRPAALAAAARRVVVRSSRQWLRRRRDVVRATFALDAPPLALARRLTALAPQKELSPLARDACERYLRHEHDLLGSGWTAVRHGLACDGLHGSRYAPAPAVVADGDGQWLLARVTNANLAECRRIWRLVRKGYEPVDWQLDFKSGYRWSEKTWFPDIRYGTAPGADVKVPWELGRGQHLPQLALAAQSTGEARWWCAVRDEILDFIAANPPRFGVQWNSTMDVAIRISNWLVAWDLCRGAGVEFDDSFEAVLARSALEHGRHVAAHLEWHATHRGNHYLSNVAGLLMVAAYLPGSPETDAWLAFGVRELVGEIGYQFGADGANFEASTCYHRLSSEMSLYAVAIVLGLPAERWAAIDGSAEAFWPIPTVPAPIVDGAETADGRRAPLPSTLLERLERMGEFTLAVTKPSGGVAQIGDNDSGRFLKLEPAWRLDAVTGLLEEVQLDHRHLVGAVGALVERADLTAAGAPFAIDGRCLVALAGGPMPTRAARRPDQRVRIGTASARSAKFDHVCFHPSADVLPQLLRFPGGSLRDGLTLSAFPEFGLFVFRSTRLFLALRSGWVGQGGYGGHAHNDQLALELTVDGGDVLVDPGSYLYTPSPVLRNAYRSVMAHAAPRIADEEPSRLDTLFLLNDDPGATCLYFGDEGVLARHVGYGASVYRDVQLHDDHIVVTDVLLPTTRERHLDRAARLEHWRSSVPFSPAYGMRTP